MEFSDDAEETFDNALGLLQVSFHISLNLWLGCIYWPIIWLIGYPGSSSGSIF